MNAPTPTTLAGFTPAWLTQQFRDRGVIGADSSVTAVKPTVLDDGQGFMGIIARLALSYDRDPGPATVIAKIPTDDELHRATGRAIGIYVREVCYYAEVLPALDVPTPKAYTAIYEADGHEAKLSDQTVKADRLPLWLLRRLIKRQQTNSHVPPCVLLLEDFGHAQPGDQVAGGSLDQIAAGLSALAQLQAQTWGVRNVPKTYWTRGGDYIPRLFHAVYLNSHDSFLKAGEASLSAHSVALFNSLKATGISRVKRHRDEMPQCLVHGDYRLDNMFFDADGSVAAVIDWQTAAPGPVVNDVAYFLVSSLPAATPESTVDELLAAHHAELVTHGVEGYPFAQFVEDYEDGLLVIMHRLAGFAGELLDLGDGRGQDLLDAWYRRLDARLQRIGQP